MSTLARAEQQADILSSLRGLKGRGTVGDVVTASGLPADEVRAGLKQLLESHRGHLAVSETGELVYDFDERLIARGTEPLLARVKRAVTDLAAKGFKAAIVVMLVVYFVAFVALAIAAIFAGDRDGDSRGSWGGRRGGGHFHLSDFWLWYWIMGSNWGHGRPYYGHDWERTLPERTRVPFYKKVFAFVFGPDEPTPTQAQLDRGTIRLIKARSGVITTSELVEHTGLGFVEAEEEMGRLLGAYDGEAAVSPDGEIVYAFPGLMVSAHDARATREPNPAWLRLEPEQPLTGNTAGANALVAGMNGFTLAAAATAPWFIFPRLGIGGPAAFVALVLVPIVFSTLFFAVPGLRMWGVKRENRRRRQRNVRRVLLGLVYGRALEADAEQGLGVGTVSVAEAIDYVRARLDNVDRRVVERALDRLAHEVDADVTVDEMGVTHYAFPAIRRQFVAAETVRQKLELDKLAPGQIVFSTSDTAAEAGERELALFDRELGADDARFDRYLPATDRVDYEHAFELVAFDEELKERGLAPV